MADYLKTGDKRSNAYNSSESKSQVGLVAKHLPGSTIGAHSKVTIDIRGRQGETGITSYFPLYRIMPGFLWVNFPFTAMLIKLKC